MDLRSLGQTEKQYNGREPSAPPSEIGSLVDPSALKELTPTGQHLDFRGLGLIDKAFVPLLEEICSWYPSLIACQQKRSRKVSKCAFTAFGELLHFLKTTTVKDMTEDICVRLQSLWEDVEIFRFDLAWLEPHVQSALRMKKFLERQGD
ncbi:uncharacterized protein LOC18786736 [Prunus persica]|nr:uncharacterized protein LOC18786736 [Prunus persica]